MWRGRLGPGWAPGPAWLGPGLGPVGAGFATLIDLPQASTKTKTILNYILHEYTRAQGPMGPMGPKIFDIPFLKPGFLRFWTFQVFRSWRIDPSRQVSMFPARAGLPSATRGLNYKKSIKNKIQKYPGNVNNYIPPYIYIYIYSIYIFPSYVPYIFPCVFLNVWSQE